MQTPAPSHIAAWLVELPLQTAFSSATTHMHKRRLIVIRLSADDLDGWGEVAPVPGHTEVDVDTIWDSLQRSIEQFQLEAPRQANGMLRAAFAQADADLSARAVGKPLWRHLGGTVSPWAGAAIGLDKEGQPDATQLQAAADAGYVHVKMKVTQQTDIELLVAIRQAFPDISFGVDANGSLDLENTERIDRLDDLRLAYIEQPGPAADLTGHHSLKERLVTPISLDESAHSPAAVDQILEIDSADIINLKVGRFGPSETLQLASRIVAAGRQVRLGGLVESGIGRGHTIALASHQLFTVVGDIAGSDRYFADDPVRPQWRIANGKFVLPSSPGLGVTVDEDIIANLAVASVRVR